MSHKEVEEKESKSDPETEVRLLSSMVESSKQKSLKRFAFVNEQGESFLMTKEEIENQKKLEQDIKADVTYEIMRKQLKPMEDPESLRGISNFTGRVTGMHVSVGNFTYVLDFIIVEDISSVIDPRLSQVVLGKPFVELSNMTCDLSLGIVNFTNGADKIAYKMPHKKEQFNSLSDLEKEP
ncbi:hypothetical protein Tco_0341032 [Tanacetum coccineum]